MYDPKTVAFDIRNPFLRNKWGDRPLLITIWHVDPESDNSDDSCDWFGGRLTGEEVSRIQKLAKSEHGFYFDYDLIAIKGADPFTVICAAWRSVKHELYKDRRYSHKDLEAIVKLATNPGDNLRAQAIAAESNPDELSRLFLLVARQIKKQRRPWWRHPRWHVHHWQLQFHPYERLRRWLFDRCEYCGGRFKSSPHSDWGGERLWHGECKRRADASSHQDR
jgi:hypothetical protein